MPIRDMDMYAAAADGQANSLQQGEASTFYFSINGWLQMTPRLFLPPVHMERHANSVARRFHVVLFCCHPHCLKAPCRLRTGNSKLFFTSRKSGIGANKEGEVGNFSHPTIRVHTLKPKP